MMGAGGIGGYIGARLAQAGADVSFIARGEHLAAMLDTGLRIHSDLGSFVLSPVSASAATADIGPVDLVIFAVKLYDGEPAAASLAPLLTDRTRVVTLQNGIDSIDVLRRHVQGDRVIGGATYLSGFIGGPGEVIHSGGLPHILVGGQHDPVIQELKTLCDRSIGLELKPVADIDDVLWEKFVTLAAFSGGTSLMRSGIGPILADPEARIFIEQLRDEGMAVADAAGHPMADGFVDRVVTRWSAFPPHVKSSMANDLERGKPIEVAWLSGRMHHLGMKLGVATPAHTAVFRALHLHAMGSNARIPT
ncbi:2-dehydropantoate 2-reductase [Mesorhizobium sp. M2D.F.Ca.ET.185.01.1.1]|nr:2-dehydropantoate 2-reductase [Mesorhizobium sp. M2D.F.Ca.ET.140.01.1.1]TGP14139.1 2-dehydropantoate 2-reductase [Mesorhizobium sp. M2D.F.Ca.ET.233.01.1.1]TGP29533.1 2-dehydropantoate 2-reductase [Mesorhizobium sp. M2D.F.Ca.ET.232.01.1.1]TGP54803.1 2-dehydropantoate 2-reductase [Mesorhizobium sp. M2D.F.Ca.ET.226.01.1.1]TGP55684.1 2-dehydropantoate 2-reductase [bacterium M00.F.Ca.ET.230.01.1.1]TGP63737.1 2-dehydropantoate 2-reductase [Mesorhizobium sp. M2D.F.Ca.ET.225.01.1.1]TGP73197.1 2-de